VELQTSENGYFRPIGSNGLKASNQLRYPIAWPIFPICTLCGDGEAVVSNYLRVTIL